MLAPECWNFSPPVSQNTVIKDFNLIKSTISRQYFTHSVVLFVPDAMTLPEDLCETLSTDSDYYYVASLPLRELLNVQFISLFVRTGSLTLHSVDTRLDMDNSIAINPKGWLIMSLNEDTFQKCGLEGTLSQFVNNKYVVKLDLKSSTFVNGSKKLQRILGLLRDLPELTFNVICAWEHTDSELCPSSLAAWFSESYEVHCCSNKFNRQTHYNVNLPDCSSDIHEIIEWASMIHLGCSMETINPALSSYQPPRSSLPSCNMTVGQWTGMLTASRVHHTFEKLQNWFEERGSNTWVMMAVLGMNDSITTFGDQEHHFYLEGDYSSTVILQPNKSVSALVHVSSCKVPKGRRRKRQEKIKYK